MTVNDFQGPEGIFGSVQVTSALGSLLVPASGMPVCVVNNDPVNSIYLGDTPSMTAGQQTTTLLGPLNVCTFDGTLPVYGITAQGITVQALLFPTGSDWSPSPIQIQEQLADLGLATLVEQINQNTAIPSNISTTGAPLLNLYTFLQGKSQTIGAGGSLVLGPYAIGQIGYEFFIELGCTQNTAVAPVSIEFQWTDSSSGLVTATQVYNMYAAYTGGGGPTHNVEGHGPSNADTLTITITATSGAIQVALAILETSRVYGRHDWRTQNPASVTITFPTMTYVSCVPAANILAAQTSPSLNSSSITYLLPFFTGSAQIWGSIAVAANAGSFLVQDALAVLSNSTLARFKTSSGDVAPSPFVLPRDQCTIQLSNGTATASTMSVGIVAQELETN